MFLFFFFVKSEGGVIADLDLIGNSSSSISRISSSKKKTLQLLIIKYTFLIALQANYNTN